MEISNEKERVFLIPRLLEKSLALIGMVVALYRKDLWLAICSLWLSIDSVSPTPILQDKADNPQSKGGAK